MLRIAIAALHNCFAVSDCLQFRQQQPERWNRFPNYFLQNWHASWIKPAERRPTRVNASAQETRDLTTGH
jgi:hypothetical protein